MKIEVKNLSYFAGNKEILKDIHADFEGQRIYGIIGPNGSGKTTLLRHIYREIPSKGCVFMDGTDISTIPGRAYSRRMAVMMQHQDLFESDLSVGNMVMTGRYPYKKLFSGYNREDEEIVNDILENNALTDYKNRKLSTLSGGELQRVMISRCFAQQPDVIVLDEPTNHLDIRYKLELMKTLRTFNGLIIMTIHDLNLAAGFCDRIYVLNKGSIVMQGTPAEVFTPELLGEIFKAEIHVYREEERIMIEV